MRDIQPLKTVKENCNNTTNSKENTDGQQLKRVDMDYDYMHF